MLRLMVGFAVLISGCGDSGADGSGGAGGDAGGTGGGIGTCEYDGDVAATRTVTFVVTNDTSTSKWLVTDAAGCEAIPVGVAGEGDAGRLLLLPFDNTCNCECAGPGPKGPHLVTEIPPNVGLGIVWDARSYELCPFEEDCGGFAASGNDSFLVPVADGTYEAHLRFYEALPTNWDCTEIGGDDIECSNLDDSVCFGDDVLSLPVTFTLAGDDVVVPVSIGP